MAAEMGPHCLMLCLCGRCRCRIVCTTVGKRPPPTDRLDHRTKLHSTGKKNDKNNPIYYVHMLEMQIIEYLRSLSRRHYIQYERIRKTSTGASRRPKLSTFINNFMTVSHSEPPGPIWSSTQHHTPIQMRDVHTRGHRCDNSEYLRRVDCMHKSVGRSVCVYVCMTRTTHTHNTQTAYMQRNLRGNVCVCLCIRRNLLYQTCKRTSQHGPNFRLPPPSTSLTVRTNIAVPCGVLGGGRLVADRTLRTVVGAPPT